MITIPSILSAVAYQTGVDAADIAGTCKTRRTTRARWMYCALCIRHTQASWHEIAGPLNKSHSMVSAWIRGHSAMNRHAVYGDLYERAWAMLGKPGVVNREPSSRKTGDGLCRVCMRPATTLDTEGDPSCHGCAAMEVAHEDEWEQYEPVIENARDEAKQRELVKRRMRRMEAA